MPCDAQSLINTAYQNGYAKLSDRDLRECVVASACAAGSGGGGSGATLTYTGESPTADGIVPPNLAAPALAYKQGGAGPIYSWNTTTHVWE